MTVEILFSEVCNLFGDGQNIEYLRACLPDAKFVFTTLNDEPFFVKNSPEIIYIGSMSELTQRRVIDKLLPHKERIKALIDQNVAILATGNAGEIFTKQIHYVTENIRKDALGIFDLSVKTDLFKRFNGKVLGEFEGIQIVGFRSQFSFLYGDNTNNYFVKCIRGVGINPDSYLEGMRLNNLICTQILGPILPLNPLFCERFIGLANESVSAAYRDAAMQAYDQRLTEFKKESTPFDH